MSAYRPLLIAALVLTEVGLWQWRVLIASRGNRIAAVVLGAVGAVLQITAISQVVTNVDDPLSVGAYAAGVGLGVLAGLVAGERLSPGSIGVTVVSGSTALAEGLWARGWPVTAQPGHGAHGPVTVVFVAISRRCESRLHRDVVELAPDATWTAEEHRARPGREVRAASRAREAAAGPDRTPAIPATARRGRTGCSPRACRTPARGGSRRSSPRA